MVEKETAESTFQIYRNMLRMDKIDIFVLGKVDREQVKRKLEDFGFTYRNPKLELEYNQEYSNITQEKSSVNRQGSPFWNWHIIYK